MPTKVKDPRPPRGFSRLMYRAPILFYTIGLGSLMGKRFLLLNHVGRKSGKPRQAALEVVAHDALTGEYFVNVGFVPRSDWYLNLLQQPETSIQVGKNKIEVTAKQCSSKKGGELLRAFAEKHPTQAKSFSSFLGYKTDGTMEDFQAMGEQLIFMRLSPR